MPGRQKEDTIVLQNDSPTQLMCLVLRVISPSRSFYILNDNSITFTHLSFIFSIHAFVKKQYKSNIIMKAI